MYIFCNNFPIDIWPSMITVSYIHSLTTVLRSSSCSDIKLFTRCHILIMVTVTVIVTLEGLQQRHFLTTGWSDFVKAKKLVPCDIFNFLRGENGELCVGVRRRMNRTPSSQNQYAILATVSHEIASGTRFLVTYTPRASQSPFIISLNKYLEAQSHRFSVGMKFEMKFEGEEVLERRFSGTIIGVGETASSKWPDSEWRSLKVRWDQEISVSCPSRVSSWEIEPPNRSQRSCCFGFVTVVVMCLSLCRALCWGTEAYESYSICDIKSDSSCYAYYCLPCNTSRTWFLVTYVPRTVLLSSSCCDIKLFF